MSAFAPPPGCSDAAHPDARRGGLAALGQRLRSWFDATALAPPAADEKRVEWLRVAPFIAMHAMCLGVFWVGWHPAAVATAAGLYLLRMFALTGFYHRYFSHRAFATSRAAQFGFALLGASATQRGPLWWAAHHRKHHRHADTPLDVHSPRQHGFLWSHVGWITSRANFATDLAEVPDLARYPELRFLDRFDLVVPLALAGALWAFGGWPYLIWGFFVSTVVLFHCTCLINSLAHRVGTRRFDTPDDSRNNFALALITLGEGWHNNHHRNPGVARQGLLWWEIDLTHCGLRVLEALHVVRDLRRVRP